ARLGSNSSLEAGHPAPHVSEDWAFKNHATGNTGVCWFMLPIQEFTGTIKIAGRGVVVQETLEAINLKKIVSAKDSALNRLYETHRDIYYRELGRAQAGWMQSGIYDGNEQNAYAMFVRVSEEDGAFLKEKGYHVEVDNGVSKLFIVGRIDTDWAGSYGASFDGARYDFEHMFGQLGGHDMARILVKSTRERMISGGEEPTTEELAREARKELEAARPHFIEGASQWYRTNGSDPSYVDGMKKLFLDNRDAPVGMEEKLSPEDLRDISEGKRILDRRLSFNGLSARPMDFSDGKSRFVPEDAIAVFNALH